MQKNLIKITPPGGETKEITFAAFREWISEFKAKGHWLSEPEDISGWQTESEPGEIRVVGLKASGEDLKGLRVATKRNER